MLPLNSAFTGTTNRLERMVMMASWRYFAAEEEMMRWSTSRALPEVTRIFRRRSASSALALSEISSSDKMAPLIFSSRYLLGVRLLKMLWIQVFSSPTPL